MANDVSVESDLVTRFRGTVIPAVPVPFDARGEIDEQAQAHYAKWMAGQRIGGVAVWAHTGRGLRLSDDQRATVLAAWQSGLGEMPIICGIGVPRGVRMPSAPAARTDTVIEHTVRLANDARRGGAAAVMVHPPADLDGMRDLDRRVLALHSAVAEVGLPVLAFYLYEAAGGIAYPPETVSQILATPGVIGMKVATLDSVLMFQRLAAVIRETPSALLITGEDRFLGYSLMLGAQAALIGLGAACTDASVALLDAWVARDYPRFHAHSEAIDHFAAGTFCEPMEGYVQRMLWALKIDGVLPGRVRDHFAPRLSPDDHDRVARAVQTLRQR